MAVAGVKVEPKLQFSYPDVTLPTISKVNFFYHHEERNNNKKTENKSLVIDLSLFLFQK